MAGEGTQTPGGQAQGQGNQGGGTSQAGGTGDQSQNQQQQQGQPLAGGQQQGVETFDREYVEKLRQEAAGHRTKAQDLQKQLDAVNNKDLTDAQKIQKQLEAVSQQNQDLASRIRNADILAAAATAKAKHPEAMVALVPADAEDYKAAMADLRKRYPDLFNPLNGGSADGGAGGGRSGPQSINDMIRQAAGRR